MYQYIYGVRRPNVRDGDRLVPIITNFRFYKIRQIELHKRRLIAID